MRLVLLGDPVEHSLSPRIHGAALQAAGLAGSYEARRVDVAGLMSAIDEIATGIIHGANVTMPHKRRALEGCTVLDRDARAAGAVNTLAGGDGEVRGWNTDVLAVREALTAMPAGPVLVLGAGGAASATVAAAGDRRVIVSARSPNAPSPLGGGTATASWGEPIDGAIVVNATPLGMHGEMLPEPVVEGAAGLVDFSYGATETPAAAAMRARGAPTVDGLTLLVAQAAASFTIWTGSSPPIEAMERAARST